MINKRADDRSSLTQIGKENDEFQKKFMKTAPISQYALKKKQEEKEKEERVHRKLLRQYKHLVDPKYNETQAQKQEGQRERERKMRMEKALYKTFDGLTSAFAHFDQLKSQHAHTKQNIYVLFKQRLNLIITVAF